MSAFDENRDGRRDIKERMDEMEFRFGDRDDDGAMNKQEFSRVENANEFGRYDTNRDGLVDAPEYARGEFQERQFENQPHNQQHHSQQQHHHSQQQQQHHRH